MYYIKVERPEGLADNLYRAKTKKEAEEIRKKVLALDYNQENCEVTITNEIPEDEIEFFEARYQEQLKYPIA